MGLSTRLTLTLCSNDTPSPPHGSSLSVWSIKLAFLNNKVPNTQWRFLAQVQGVYETYEGSPASQGQLQYDLWNVGLGVSDGEGSETWFAQLTSRCADANCVDKPDDASSLMFFSYAKPCFRV
jgi:hypothetical protein